MGINRNHGMGFAEVLWGWPVYGIFAQKIGKETPFWCIQGRRNRRKGMEEVISKYEAQFIMQRVGRGAEFDHLLYNVLPSLVDEWAAQGVEVSIEHCFVRRGNACALRIDCQSALGTESHTVLLNSDPRLFAVFTRGKLLDVVSGNKLTQFLNDLVRGRLRGKNRGNAQPI